MTEIAVLTLLFGGAGLGGASAWTYFKLTEAERHRSEVAQNP